MVEIPGSVVLTFSDASGRNVSGVAGRSQVTTMMNGIADFMNYPFGVGYVEHCIVSSKDVTSRSRYLMEGQKELSLLEVGF